MYVYYYNLCIYFSFFITTFFIYSIIFSTTRTHISFLFEERGKGGNRKLITIRNVTNDTQEKLRKIRKTNKRYYFQIRDIEWKRLVKVLHGKFDLVPKSSWVIQFSWEYEESWSQDRKFATTSGCGFKILSPFFKVILCERPKKTTKKLF